MHNYFKISTVLAYRSFLSTKFYIINILSLIEDGTESGVVKEAFNALATVFLEAAKHDQHPDSLRSGFIFSLNKLSPTKILLSIFIHAYYQYSYTLM